MTDTLFDPNEYGPGRVVRAKRESDMSTVANDGAWFVMTRRNSAPHEFAHRVDLTPILRGKPPRDEGARRSHCGIVGRPLLVEGAVEVRPCPKCRKP